MKLMINYFYYCYYFILINSSEMVGSGIMIITLLKKKIKIQFNINYLKFKNYL